MNLRGIANQVSQVVNPNEVVTVLMSTGFTVGTGAKQVPTYDAVTDVPAQIQALDNQELKHLDSLNIQGDIKAIYLYPSLAGVVRPSQKGGDIVRRSGQFAGDWLVVKVLEEWTQWTKCAIVLQEPTP